MRSIIAKEREELTQYFHDAISQERERWQSIVTKMNERIEGLSKMVSVLSSQLEQDESHAVTTPPLTPSAGATSSSSSGSSGGSHTKRNPRGSFSGLSNVVPPSIVMQSPPRAMSMGFSPAQVTAALTTTASQPDLVKQTPSLPSLVVSESTDNNNNNEPSDAAAAAAAAAAVGWERSSPASRRTVAVASFSHPLLDAALGSIKTNMRAGGRGMAVQYNDNGETSLKSISIMKIVDFMVRPLTDDIMSTLR